MIDFCQPFMKSLQLFLMFLLPFVFLNSLACSCKRFTVENLVDDANWIFTAKITKLELSKEKDEFDGDLITVGFTEAETIKGDLGQLTQLITSTSTCGVDYEISRTYLLMADQDGITNICTGTMQIILKETLAYFEDFDVFLKNIKAYVAGTTDSIKKFYNPISRRILNGPQKQNKPGRCKSGGK